MAKRVLLLGGTGAMGVYLAPELIRRGYQVDVTTRGSHRSGVNIRYIHGDARDNSFIKKVLKTKYDAIVDFMVYPTDEFKSRVDTLLGGTDHYIFVSTYRVFADNDMIISEVSPRLLDVSQDTEYLETDEYALQKARQEDILRSKATKHWTIIRPSITYSKKRFQLGVLEAPYFIGRALEGKETVFPAEMLEKKTTMTWAGDVAKMIASLTMSESAMGEDYNVVTSESYTWAQIIDFYQDVINLKTKIIPLSDFLGIYPGRYQVIYDRMYDRAMDNSKILKATGMRQSDLMALGSGLAQELGRFINTPDFGYFDGSLNDRIDDVTEGVLGKVRKKARLGSRARSVRQKIRIRTRARDLKKIIRIRTRVEEYKRTKLNHRRAGAVITLTSVFNYGNIVQRYALKAYLRQQGYDFDSINTPSWVDGMSDEIFGKPREFVARYIGGEILNPNIHKNYKTYIVGSDQVWRNWYGDNWSSLAPYFLNFVEDKDTTRVSYAASFGVDTLGEAEIDVRLRDNIRPLLDRFDHISVREESGVDLVREILGSDEKDIKVVADPTLLLSADDYSSLIDNSEYRNIKTGKVFSYILDKSLAKEKLVKRISSQYGGDYQIINPDVNIRYESVEEWLKGFRDASVVVTDSFHGMVFAIINRKNFVVINNAMRGSARFNSLLRALSISSDRIVDESNLESLSFESLRPIEWSDVESRLELIRGESSDWLLGALSEVAT